MVGKVIDLFCGAGGLSAGFHQAGFDVLLGQDWDGSAAETFKASHSGAKYLGGSVEHVDSKDILKFVGLKRGQLDVLVGGPPCQGFSVNNHKRVSSDPRTQLFKHYLRILDGLKPNWLVMENVTGMLSLDNGRFVAETIFGMQALGYSVECKVLKAEEFGVPQERRRLVFIGNRIGLPVSFPEPSHGKGKRSFTTVWDAISDLPALANGESTLFEAYRSAPQNDYQRRLRIDSLAPLNHRAPKLSGLNMTRLEHIPQGGSWRDIPIFLLPEGMKKAKRSDHTKRYGRPRKNDLACTILTKCDIHWGAYIHPTQNRALTVREAARLQSFPDNFQFLGCMTEQFKQVGNAVPPLLARCIAENILEIERIGARPSKSGAYSEAA